MRSMASAFVSVPLLVASAFAQSTVVPNANAAVRGTGGLNTVTRNAANPRTYMLGIPASQLAAVPMGAKINGVSFRSNITTSNPATWPPTDTTWTDYEVLVGAAIPVATWTTTFATNWSGTPTMVRDGGMLIETGVFSNNTALPAPQPNAWGDFFWDFQQTHTYTGGDLGILLSHVGSNQATSALFVDTVVGAPATGVAYSGTGHQVATGAVAAFSIVRIHWGYGNGCAGTAQLVPNLVLTNNVAGGGPTKFAIGNAKASAPAAYAFGLTQSSVQLPNGCTLLTPPAVVLPVTTTANGRFLLTIQVPAGIAGTVHVQAFVVDSGAPGSLAGSNGVSLTVTP